MSIIGENLGKIIITSSFFYSLSQCYYIYKTNRYIKNKPTSINNKNIYRSQV